MCAQNVTQRHVTMVAINKIDKKLYLCINKIFFDPFTNMCTTKTLFNFNQIGLSPHMHAYCICVRMCVCLYVHNLHIVHIDIGRTLTKTKPLI